MKTRNRALIAGIAGACAVFVGATGAQAAMVTFTHHGFGSGTIDGVPFGLAAPVEFTITAVGDTDDNDTSIADVVFNPHTSASIDIVGVGTFSFLVPTRTFVNNVNGVVGFSRTVVSGLDLFNGPQNAVFEAWDMLSSIGPISGEGGLLQWNSIDVDTSGGVLVFDGGSTTATFTAVVVPSPATVGLAAIALLGVRRRR